MAIPDMVFYYLTPAGFRRYDTPNLCPPFPAGVQRLDVFRRGGIELVNPAAAPLIPLRIRPQGVSVA